MTYTPKFLTYIICTFCTFYIELNHISDNMDIDVLSFNLNFSKQNIQKYQQMKDWSAKCTCNVCLILSLWNMYIYI